MFTGIVEEKGTIHSLEQKKNLYVLKVKAKKILKNIKLGDSIAVNGVCLSVTGRKNGVLSFDVMKETIAKTTLKTLKPKDKVNLERALKAASRFGGHLVTGHIDGAGKIRRVIKKKNYVELQIGIAQKLLKFVVAKGSVCVDGVSLTVGEVKAVYFSVYLIPLTVRATTLGSKKKGDDANIETDIFAKYLLSKKR